MHNQMLRGAAAASSAQRLRAAAAAAPAAATEAVEAAEIEKMYQDMAAGAERRRAVERSTADDDECASLLERAIARRIAPGTPLAAYIAASGVDVATLSASELRAFVYGDSAGTCSDTSTHQCSVACVFEHYCEGAEFVGRGGVQRRASGDHYVCVETGRVHTCTEVACNARVDTLSAVTCAVTGRERTALYQYTLGAAAGHTASGALHAAAATTGAAASATDERSAEQRAADAAYAAAAAARRAAAPRPFTKRVMIPAEGRSAGAYSGVAVGVDDFDAREHELRLARAYTGAAAPVLPGHAVSAATVAARRRLSGVPDRRPPRSASYFEHAYGGNLESKRALARSIVAALLCSEPARAAFERHRAAPLRRADAAVVLYITECANRSVMPNACGVYERFARHVQTLDTADGAGAGAADAAYAGTVALVPPHLADHLVHACMQTWACTCRARVANDPDAKTHPSFAKHCIGLLYRVREGFSMSVCVDAADFAGNAPLAAEVAQNVICRDFVFVQRNDTVGAALPALEDIDAVLRDCGAAGDMKYVREGKTTQRDCYNSLIAERRAALRAAIAAARDRDACSEAVGAFFEHVAALEYGRVVGAVPPLPAPETFVAAVALGARRGASV